MNSIVATRMPLEKVNQDALEAILTTEGYALIRGVISAKCIEAQTEFMDASLYENTAAEEKAMASLERAKRYNAALNVLDEVEETGQEWYRIKLEDRR